MKSRAREKTHKFNISPNSDKIGDLIKKILIIIGENIEDSSELEFKIELALRETLANAIEHGSKLAAENDLDEELEIIIGLKIQPDKILIQVEDPGPGFNWEDCNLKMTPNFEEKGRGLKMINVVADKIEFNQQGNKITVVFDFKNQI